VIERELFLAALELKDPRERAQYLDQACAGDHTLRAGVEALLNSHEEAGSFLELPAAYDVNVTTAQPIPGDPNAGTAQETIAPSSGPSPASTQADTEATGADVTRPVADTMENPEDATGNWSPGFSDSEATTDGPGAERDVSRGTLVRYFGDYEILKELGRGGMGVVYKARQVSLNRHVALKMIKAGVLADDDELRRFQNEAEAVALLDHPGIVPVYEVGDHDGQRYFAMKLVEGGNLADQLESFKARPRAAAALLSETAEAVHHAHMRGILHRDLKPANILIDSEGHPHVTDFGLAKRVEGDVEMTASGAILGTPAYMSPEQAHGRRGSITTATDVYGLGAILYALLTGKAPFGGDSVIETVDAVRNRPPEPPKKLNPHVPPDLETICLKCLEKDPRRRYASAHELAADLDNWLDSRPIMARRVGPAERAWLWCKRKPVVAALAAAVVLAVIGGTAAVIAVQARANRDLLASNTKLDQQRARAEDREAQAIKAVKNYGDVVRNEPALMDDPVFEDLRKRLLNEPLSFFRSLHESLQADHDTRPESLGRLAQASFDLGKLTNEIGDKQDAQRALEESLTIRSRLVREHPAEVQFQVDLAMSYFHIAIMRRATGRVSEAAEFYDQASAILARLVRANPSVALYQRHLADILFNVGLLKQETGHTKEALSIQEESLAIRDRLTREHPAEIPYQSDLAMSQSCIGILLKEQGRPVEALAALEKAVSSLELLRRDRPSAEEILSDLAENYDHIGVLRGELNRPAEALAAHEQARVIHERLTLEHPSVTRFQSDLASNQNNTGVLLYAIGRPVEALAAHEQARVIQERLTSKHPSVVDFQSSLARSYNNIGNLQNQLGKKLAALAAHEQARAIRERLTRAEPTLIEFQDELMGTYINIGNIESVMGRQTESLASLGQALVIAERLAKAHPESPDYASNLGATLNNIAVTELELRRFDAALTKLVQAVVWQRKALASNPANPTYRQFLDNHYLNLTRAAEGLGRIEEAEEARRERAALRDSDPVIVALDARLSLILQGDQQPGDNRERLQLAQRAYNKALHAASAKLFADAIDADPKLAEDRQLQIPYNAACAAALAGCGQGKDNPAPENAAKAKLREQARGWLTSELTFWTKLLESGPPQARPIIAQTLQHWKEDQDLAGVRQPNLLDTLPEAEREAWRTLWASVEALLEKVRAVSEPKK
jgi:eukaryotic-like serine/threonine-protein kinase